MTILHFIIPALFLVSWYLGYMTSDSQLDNIGNPLEHVFLMASIILFIVCIGGMLHGIALMLATLLNQ